MRLDRYLTHTGFGSRSEVQKLVRSKKVKVNDEVIKKPEFNVDPMKDCVRIGKEEAAYREHYYYILNKPAGVITATEDARQETVMDLFEPRDRQRGIAPVGRLDKDTEGMLILTTDGQFNHSLMSPRKHVDKVYYAEVAGIMTQEDVEAFEKGVDIGEAKVCMAAQLEILGVEEQVSHVHLTLREGKFHQVKRMVKAVGKEVTYLKRVKMGELDLPEDLEVGAYRQLTEAELEALKGE